MVRWFSRMSRKSLLLLTGVWIALAASDVTYNPSPTTSTTTATTVPTGEGIIPPPDVTAEVVILAPPFDTSRATHKVNPTAKSLGSISITVPSTNSSSQETEDSVNNGVPQGRPRVLSKRSEVRGWFLRERNGLGVCSPATATHYLTITSTHISPTVTYATATLYIPNVISEELTETIVRTSTVGLTQTVTIHARPTLITETQVMTAPRHVVQVQRHTQTTYVTTTDTRTYTDKEVQVTVLTDSRVITNTVTNIITTTTTTTLLRTSYSTATHTQYVTRTQSVARYIAETITSSFHVYQTVTYTTTEDEYITSTSVHINTILVTSCSSYPMYTYPVKAPYYG